MERRSRGAQRSGARSGFAVWVVVGSLVFLLPASARTTAKTVVNPAPGSSRGDERAPIEDGLRAVLGQDGQVSLEVLPHKGEGLTVLAHRLCGDSRLAPQVREVNGGHDLEVGKYVRIPLTMLTPEWQVKALQSLFPNDHAENVGWRHQVRGAGSLRRESLWSLAEWFTGKGENFVAIRDYNHLHDEDVQRGASVIVPAELLRPAFGTLVPVAEKPPPPLTFGKDGTGEYAIYELRPGEALYSAVVVRFTGRIYAADVNALSADIAKRNGIEDVTDIPAGFRVKIPLEVVQPEFLPAGDSRRAEYDAGLRASAHFSNQVKARGLDGITIIIDAGHGGQDTGAILSNVWESLYVYDIALRVRNLLMSETAAHVQLTTRDGEDYRLEDRDVLSVSRGHAVLTTPPYPISDSTVGVHLRWYLANSVFRHALEQDSDTQKVIFLSIHADSLHPSLRGAMAYIPAARLRNESYGKSGPAYAERREVQEQPIVNFPERQRVASEGLSRQLAQQVIGAIEEASLPVHPFTPVRDKIIRNSSEWVPAVLRYNAIPAKMLLEICNLANDEDRRLIQTRTYRRNMSEAIVEGILAYYGQGKGSAAAIRVARAGR
jgi:N-acetylmuramoyl-L-alanine amidase